ncbi:MAG: hypothetical protein HFJ02_00575 [Bacilli bacterium]|nr:hypothetical protein [Bacilli bacterium]
MGNVLTTVKRFLGNKNTVTILGVLLGILVLYVFYNYRVKQATTPVSVPYAKVDLSSRTLITEDMIGFMEVSSSVVKNSPNLITDRKSLLDHYVAFGTTIPANSLFYTSQILDKNKMPDSAFANIPDGYTIYSLGVDLHSTYGNSIYPDNYIDLYFKAVDDTGVVMYGKLIESIKVLAVKDSQGNHVFETTVESRTPSELLFAVPDNMFDLLRRADYITGSSIEITPVPRNASYSANPGETLITSEQIKNFINAKSISAVQDQPIQTTPDENDNDTVFDFDNN